MDKSPKNGAYQSQGTRRVNKIGSSNTDLTHNNFCHNNILKSPHYEIQYMLFSMNEIVFYFME